MDLRRLPLAAPALILALTASSQDAVRADDGPLSWPRDRERVIARVAGDDLTLGDLVDHVAARHDPLFETFLSTPEGNRMLGETRYGADWVRQFADITALQREAERRGVPKEDSDAALSAALKKGFENWLKLQKLPEEMTQERVNFYLARYQRWFGLQTEVQGWLQALTAKDPTEKELREYYAGHAREFGGRVTFSHILVRNRDPYTLRLLGPAERQKAWDKIASIRARLKPDGSNFEDLAAEMSEDRKTASRGGKLEYVERFDPQLPAALVRTAWNLPDGGISEPILSPYGIHLIKRQSYLLHQTFLYTPDAQPYVLDAWRQHQQENLLFGLRDRDDVQLLY